MPAPIVHLLLIFTLALSGVATAAETFRCGAESYTIGEGKKLEVQVVRSGDLSMGEKARLHIVSVTPDAHDANPFRLYDSASYFQPGQSTAIVNLWFSDNQSWSGDLEAVIQCANEAGQGGTARVKVIEDEPLPDVTLSRFTVTEGMWWNYHEIVFYPRLGVDLPFEFTLGTGKDPGPDVTLNLSDFTTSSPTFKVHPVSDDLWENDDVVPIAFKAGPFQAAAAIHVWDDDNPQPRFAQSYHAFHEPLAAGAIVVDRPGLKDQSDDLTIKLFPKGGVWPVTSWAIHFEAGEQSAQALIPVDDSEINGDRAAMIALYRGERWLGSADVVIFDDDALSITYAIEQLAVSTLESRKLLPVVLKRGGSTSVPSAIEVRLVPLAPLSQTAIPAVAVSFAAGELSKEIAVPIDDAFYSGDRTVEVQVVAAGVVRATASTTIVEDEQRPTLTLGDAVGDEGGAGVQFQFSVSPPYAASFALQLRSVDGTAISKMSLDYVSVNHTATVKQGESGKALQVTTFRDGKEEPNEHFTLSVTAELPYQHGTTVLEAKGTIRDADSGVPKLAPEVNLLEKGRDLQLALDTGAVVNYWREAVVRSSNPKVATAPAAIPILSNTRTATFAVSGVSRGTSRITATLPSGREASADVQVFESHALYVSPSAVRAASGASAQLWVTLVPASDSDVVITARSLDPTVVQVDSPIVVPPNGTTSVELRLVGSGTTAVELTLPADHGGTVESVEVTTSAPARRRAVRH